ncbi:MAG TPA: DUF4136 domain-containing protein [Gemmatimonadales bacterium]
MMRLTPAFTAAVALTLAACTSVPRVRTAVSPDRGIGGLHTFAILPAPRHVGETEGSSAPMVDNSGANRALRDALREASTRRGYAVGDSSPDFAVAYYATTKDKLDIMRWDYGYPWWPRWWRGWGPRGPVGPMEETDYAPGTVVVDVIDPTTRELLWRGKGFASLSDHGRAYELGLQKASAAIVAKFPRARRG